MTRLCPPAIALLTVFLVTPLPVIAADARDAKLDGAWAFTAGVQADDQDARSVVAGLSYAFSDALWLNADAGFTRQATPADEPSIRSRALGLGLDYDFGVMGVQLNADYWGDPGELVRNGITAALYVENDATRLSVQGIYRDYTLTARITDDQGNLSDIRDFGMSSTGIGAALRTSSGPWFAGLRAAWFDFSRNPEIFRSRAAYRALSLSALTLANSFIDYGARASLGREIGLKSLELEVGMAKSAVDDADIRTLAIYFVAPLGERTDIEISVGANNSDGFDSTLFGGVSLTWFGR